LEIDKHADTLCFGSSFVPLYWTGQVCDVTPFLSDYTPMTNVHIVSACTAYDDQRTGRTIIMEFHQGLWSGNKMTHSLINPNQCQAYGIQICDDPYDPHHQLGIHDPVTDITIPMEMFGSFACVTTRTPTSQELRDCPQIIMMSEDEWDPLTIHLVSKSKEEEEYSNLVSSVQISNVKVDAYPNEPQMIHPMHETDLLLSSVSSALTYQTMVPRMVAAVQVATYMREDELTVGSVKSRERHSAVNAEELSRKWHIGLETARKTLKVTTQFGIRHALHPL
jgi:hypothetical protein